MSTKGVSAGGGVVPGRGLPKGRCLPMGGLPGGVYIIPRPVNRIADRCKHITLFQTSFAGGKKIFGSEAHGSLARTYYHTCA